VSAVACVTAKQTKSEVALQISLAELCSEGVALIKPIVYACLAGAVCPGLAWLTDTVSAINTMLQVRLVLVVMALSNHDHDLEVGIHCSGRWVAGTQHDNCAGCTQPMASGICWRKTTVLSSGGNDLANISCS
jgi:hypothetical protein